MRRIESYSAGLCTQIPSLPTARQSLPISRVLPDKPKGPRNSPYAWRKSDKYNMFDNKDVRHPNRYVNEISGMLKKEDTMFQRRQSSQFSELGAYNLPVITGKVPSLSALIDSSIASKNRQTNTVSWNANETSPPGNPMKNIPGTSVSWNCPKENNDKELWENRMKENAELLRLYKHGFPSLVNQTRLPSTSPNNPNGYSEELKGDPQRVKPDKIYLNIDPIKDVVNYEPLSKSIPNSRLSHIHPVSRIINGYKANPGIMFSSEKSAMKGSFTSSRLAGESNGNYNGTNYSSAFETPKSPLVKVWGARSLSSISERVVPLPNGPSKSAFTRPEIYKSLTSIAELHKIEKSIKFSTNSTKPTDLLVSELAKGNKLMSPTKDVKRGHDRRHNNNHITPFKSHMKRSLAIYLGVDPEIDTVQYQPLNKSLSKLNHTRHVFSSQYCRMQELGRKDDRDMRVQSKKKSVYSCGYDVSSINVMLQNAKKRFKCCDS